MEAGATRMRFGENFHSNSIIPSMNQVPVKYEPERTSSGEVMSVQSSLDEIDDLEV